VQLPHVVESGKRLERSEAIERLKRLERAGLRDERSKRLNDWNERQ